MTYIRFLLLLCLLLPPLGALRAEAPAGEEAKIRALMRGTWDRPEAPLTVGPIVVSGRYALAGWAQGDSGGRALLQSRHGAWTVLFCSGDALKEEKTLTGLGVGPATARALAAALAEAEAKLDAQHVAKFSRFAGLVKMNEHGQHPPGHGPQHGKEKHAH